MEEIYLWIENKAQGPFKKDQVLLSLGQSQIPLTLPAWQLGEQRWKPVGKLLSVDKSTFLPNYDASLYESEADFKRLHSVAVASQSAPETEAVQKNDAKTIEAAPEPVIRNSNNNLWDDLKLHAGEIYQKGDAEAGWKLIKETAGVVSLFIFLAHIEAFLTNGRGSYALNQAAMTIFRIYFKANEEKRRQIRATVSFARSGFGLFQRFMQSA